MHVTVLMAVYNGRNSVLNAVESIINQTYDDWDFLIVDDASTDGTSELLQSLAARDARITVIKNPINRQLAASLNIGWRQACGELIARMDADDISLPERLERQVEFMQAHPDVAVLGTGAELVDEAGQSLGIAFRPAEHAVLAAKIYKECPFIHPSVMIRRSFLEALGGYDERRSGAEDYDLWLRAYTRFRFHNLQEALVRYRVRRTVFLKRILVTILVLVRAAYRDKHLLTGGWYALRLLLAATLTKMGLYWTRLR